MRAIGFYTPQPITSKDALVDLDLPMPEASGHDLLVEIKAVSVNPVDTKVRRNHTPAAGEARILGYDAAGVVEAVGEAVTRFKPGDAVYYAGDITRSGSNAQFQLVDERIAGLQVIRGYVAPVAVGDMSVLQDDDCNFVVEFMTALSAEKTKRRA